MNFLFAATGLRKGSGGIAELSRQVLKTLFEMHAEGIIVLQVHVLDETGPESGDELFAAQDRPEVRWYAGRRGKFALGVLFSGADVQLFDHVGLARLQGMNPLARGRYLLLIHSVEMWKEQRADYARTAARARMLIANSEYTARRTREKLEGVPPIRVCWPGKDCGHDPQSGGQDHPEQGSVLRPPSIGTHVGANIVRDRDDQVAQTHSEPMSVIQEGLGTREFALGPHAMLIVGRLDSRQRHKGHDHLLEALPLIADAVPDAKLVVVGGGDDLEHLRTLAQQHGVADRVVFTGWLDETELQRLYDECALFVMPSEGDGFGIVFLEAMMHELPCVGLRGGAAAEIFEDGSSGVLVDRDDTAGMAHTLAELLLDAERRRRMGEAAFERYRSVFTGRHYDRRLRGVLAEALGSSP